MPSLAKILLNNKSLKIPKNSFKVLSMVIMYASLPMAKRGVEKPLLFMEQSSNQEFPTEPSNNFIG